MGPRFGFRVSASGFRLRAISSKLQELVLVWLARHNPQSKDAE